MGYRRGAHTVFEIHLHLVWTTKYRKPLLTGEVALRARELIRQSCRAEEVDILKGHISRDHVHLFLSLPPQVTISRLVQRLKGRTSHALLHEFAHLRKAFWGRHLWARGYFCCSSGNVTDAVIMEYIENQRHEEDADFRVEGEDGAKEAPNGASPKRRPKPSA
jgi:putative transposase